MLPHRCALAVLALLAMTTNPAAQESEPRPIYMLMCDKVGVPMQITLDGVVLDRSDKLESSAMGASLNHWLRAGKNTIRIQSLPGAKLAQDAHLRCTVTKEQAGSIVSTDDAPAPDKTLATFEWPAKGAKGSGAIDHTLDLAIAEKDAPQSELWTRAEKLTLDPPTRRAILKLYEDYEAALRSGDAARVIAFQRWSGEDAHRCLGKSPFRWERDVADSIRYHLDAMKKGKFQPWDPAKAKIDLGAGGLVAHVTVDGAAPIVVVIEDGKSKRRMTFAPYVGKIDGKLVLVR